MPQRLEFDVVVIGGGPAGSLAAKTAANEGAEVLLIEEHREIGAPVKCCGMFLTGRGLAGKTSPLLSQYASSLTGTQLIEQPFKRLGLNFDKRLILNEIYGVHFFLPRGLDLKLEEKEPIFFVLNREYLDKHLAAEAARSGAHVMTETKAVGLLRDGDKVAGVIAERKGKRIDIPAKIVVGADGFFSQVGKWANMKQQRDYATLLQYEMVGVKLENSKMKENHTLPPMNRQTYGYAYVNPTGEDTARVGIGILAGTHIDVSKCFALLKETSQTFLTKLEKAQIIGELAGVIPLSNLEEETVTDNVMIVGDAAGQAGPLSGDGIYPAMFCGRIAGEVAARAVEEGNTSRKILMEYEERWRKALVPKYRQSIKRRGMHTKVTEALMDMPAHQFEALSNLLKDEEFAAALSDGRRGKTIWSIVKQPKAIRPLLRLLRNFPW